MFIWKGAVVEPQGRVFYRSFAKSTAFKRSQCSPLSVLRCRHYIISNFKTEATLVGTAHTPPQRSISHALPRRPQGFNGLVVSPGKYQQIGYSYIASQRGRDEECHYAPPRSVQQRTS